MGLILVFKNWILGRQEAISFPFDPPVRLPSAQDSTLMLRNLSVSENIAKTLRIPRCLYTELNTEY